MAAPSFTATGIRCRREYGTSLRETIAGYRDDGWSMAVVAANLDCTPVTLRRWCNRYSIQFDRSAYRVECRGGYEHGRKWTPRMRKNRLLTYAKKWGIPVSDPQIIYLIEKHTGMRK